jgi:hypothetical protein
MRSAFTKAFRIFKYLSPIFTVVFWIYMIYDDYIFVEKYGWSLQLIGAWFVWFMVYFMVLTIYFWILSSAIIIVRHFWSKRKRDAKN